MSHLSFDGLPTLLKSGDYLDLNYQFFEEIDSTNWMAEKQISSENLQNALFVAKKQFSGKGRLTRPFESPEGGIYMSMLFYRNDPLSTIISITQATAVAICRAFKKKCQLNLSIKWVNDLFWNQKKCGGILVQTQVLSSKLTAVIIGVGINYQTTLTSFSDPLSDILTSIYPNQDPPVSIEEMIFSIYHETFQIFKELENKLFMKEYREQSFLIGKKIKIMDQHSYFATAKSIANDGNLLVELEDGTHKKIFFGDIRIQPID